MARPIFDRMMARTERAANGCLIFTGAHDGGGYGQVSTTRGVAPAKAHRIAYEHHFGPVPPGMQVCHSCDTPPCVEPEHLRADTPAGNAHDATVRNRRNPRSLLNLRAGRRGHRGAAPIEESQYVQGN